MFIHLLVLSAALIPSEFPLVRDDSTEASIEALAEIMPDGTVVYWDSNNTNYIHSTGKWKNQEYEPSLNVGLQLKFDKMGTVGWNELEFFMVQNELPRYSACVGSGFRAPHDQLIGAGPRQGQSP